MASFLKRDTLTKNSVPFTLVMELWYTYMYPGARAYLKCTNYMYHVLFRSVLDSSVPFTFVMELWYTYMYPGARAYPRCTNYMYHCSDQF